MYVVLVTGRASTYRGRTDLGGAGRGQRRARAYSRRSTRIGPATRPPTHITRILQQDTPVANRSRARESARVMNVERDNVPGAV